jgi:hypothetical protein
MSQVYSVRINRKDLYSKNYDEIEYVNKDERKRVKINKSMVEVFIRMLDKI